MRELLARRVVAADQYDRNAVRARRQDVAVGAVGVGHQQLGRGLGVEHPLYEGVGRRHPRS
ncbi:hypothetical protein ACIBI9_19125 [Nonomuraea sp. NPDC050451]|uniref:hypothetical protein n=1 Tax=Nonomuraea sp. NPDC050451 TaxID=3364364 RepID=UPI0037B297FF